MKPLFDLLVSPLGLPVSTFWEWVILAVIGFMSYLVAYRAVGELYDEGLICGRFFGRNIHWIVRLLFFVFIWAITYEMIAAVKLVMAHRDTLKRIGICTLCSLPVIGAAAYRGKGE